VEPPTRQGFGARLMHDALQAHGGKVEQLFAPDGFQARIEISAG
jgi:hypothetical protein